MGFSVSPGPGPGQGILRLGVDDLADCLALAADRQWPTERRKWRLLLEIGDAFGLRDCDGTLIGSTILTRYGPDLAAISMVLIATRYGRRGLGGALVRHALALAAPATVVLNATEYGQPLYQRLGFVPVDVTRTHFGDFTPQPPAADGPDAHGPHAGGRNTGDLDTEGLDVEGLDVEGPDTEGPDTEGLDTDRLDLSGSLVRPVSPGDLPALRALDTVVNGADRRVLLDRLPDFAERLHVVERDGVVCGYGVAWRNGDILMVGPVIAPSVTDATRLIGSLAADAGSPVRLDLDDRYPQLHGWAARRGLTHRASVTVMVHGGRQLPGDRSRWFVPFSQATG